MQNLLASRWIAGNQKITENKMDLDAMMVGGGSKNATNKKNIASTSITYRAMRAASASAEDDSNNTADEKKNILPSLKGVPNSKLRGSGGASFAGNGSKKKTGDATNQPIVCYACPPPSANTGTPTTLSSFGENAYKHKNYLGCKHYRRKCKIVPACCKVPLQCSFCHDDNSDNAMDRYNTKEMQCMKSRVDPTDCKKLQKLQSRNGAVLLQSRNLSTIYKMARASITARFVTSAERQRVRARFLPLHEVQLVGVSLVMGPRSVLAKNRAWRRVSGVQRFHVRFRNAGKNATVWALDAHPVSKRTRVITTPVLSVGNPWVISPSISECLMLF